MPANPSVAVAHSTRRMVLTLLVLLLTLLAADAFRRRPTSFVPKRLSLNKEIPKISQSIDVNNLKQESIVNIKNNINKIDEKWVSRLVLLTVSAFYGTNFGCVKILDEALSPSVAATLRFSLAASIFFPSLLKLGKDNPILVKGGLEVGIYLSLGYWAQAQSLLTSSASTAAFICSLAVVVVPMLDAIFGSKSAENKPWYSSIVSPSLAVAGVGCLELGGTEVPGVGDLFALLQPIFFGLAFWRVEKHMRNSTKPGDTQAFTGAMLLVVALFSMLWTSNDFIAPLLNSNDGDLHLLWNGISEQLAAFKDWHVGLAIVWTGVVTTALTSFCENFAMKKLSASESTVIYSTEPLWGAAFASIFLHEKLGYNTGIGAILIMLACVWSSIGPTVMLPVLSTAQLSFGELYEEIVENIDSNIVSLLGSLSEKSEIP